MDNFESTVVDTLMESVPDDAAQAPETNADSLDAVLADNDPSAEDIGDADTVKGEESKALRGRMKSYETKGYNRGKREAEAAWEQEKRSYEERLAKYAQRDIEDEAKQLAADKHIPYDFALEHVQMRHGMNGNETAAQNAQPQQVGSDAKAEAGRRANELMLQAEAFEKFTDGAVTRDDILHAFQNDPEIRAAVRSGDMDFSDVGKRLIAGDEGRPSVVKNPNGNGIRKRTFMNMSDADFDKINERVKHGAVFDSRR